ncbi:MAG: hypothetical protein EPO41_05695 [Reyranella sp.]|nr:MAG: hypothetical protein EPO41_05695 [Reyranella sp.]
MAEDMSVLEAALAQGENVILFGASETPPESDRQLGKTIFEETLADLAAKICSDKRIISILERDRELEEVTLITTILDIVLTSVGGVPVLVLTAMIVKYGIRRLCPRPAQ